MPIRAATVADAAGIVSCINSMWAYLRARNALNENVADWTLATAAAWRQAGHKFWVYADNTQAGRIDAVCVYSMQRHDRRGLGMEPWMVINILAVRAQTLADTAQNHETYSLRALKLAIPEAVQQSGAVGVTAQYAAGWQRLDNFFASWPGASNVREVSPDGKTVRRWIVARPGLPDFTSRTATVG